MRYDKLILELYYENVNKATYSYSHHVALKYAKDHKILAFTIYVLFYIK